MKPFRQLQFFGSIVGVVAGIGMAAACAETEGELLSVPYRNFTGFDASLPEEPDAEPVPTATATEAVTTLPPEPPPPPPANACNPFFCPTGGFGTTCCTPDGQCGLEFGLGCIPGASDAGNLFPPAPPPPPPVDVQCRRDGDCTGGQVCCADGALTVFACAESCAADAVAVTCSGPADCPDGETCCGTRQGGASYTDLSCAAACDGTDQNSACADDTDCTAGSCQPSQFLPDGFLVCR